MTIATENDDHFPAKEIAAFVVVFKVAENTGETWGITGMNKACDSGDYEGCEEPI